MAHDGTQHRAGASAFPGSEAGISDAMTEGDAFMGKPNLAACPSCARHVRSSEPACPFCHAPLDDAFRVAPPRLAPGVRLTRAALFALGAGVALTPACSSKSSEPTILPAYGAAVWSDASIETASDAAAGPFQYEPETDGSATPNAADASPSDAGDANASDAEGDASPDAADAF